MVTASGTAIATPQKTVILKGWLYIATVRYRFPPGPMGCLGFYLTSGNDQIIPFPPSQPWIVGDDEELTVDYQGQAGSGLTCVTANVGNFSHEILLTIQYYDAATVAAGSSVPLGQVVLNEDDVFNSAQELAPGIERLFQVNVPADELVPSDTAGTAAELFQPNTTP